MIPTTGTVCVNDQLARADTEWRLISYDEVSGRFQKGDNPRTVWLPFDILMSCSSVVAALDEVLDIIELASAR